MQNAGNFVGVLLFCTISSCPFHPSHFTFPMATIPTLEHEMRLWSQGYPRVAGVDEVGRGALAGPVVAGAVVLPNGCAQDGVWLLVRDSKQISAAQRETLAEEIRARAADWGVGSADAAEIDRIGIAAATRLAMTRALASFTPGPDYLLIDWVRLNALNIPQESMVKADTRIVSVAAASILAKVCARPLDARACRQMAGLRLCRQQGLWHQRPPGGDYTLWPLRDTPAEFCADAVGAF